MSAEETVRVQHLTLQDKDGFLKLLRGLTDVPELDDATFLQIMQRRSMMGCSTFVAKIAKGNTKETIVGTASVLTQHKFSRGGVILAQLEDVIVSEKARGHGVGKALIAHIKEKVRMMGCYKVAVGAADANAAAFYRKCGFHTQGDYLVAHV
jgi:GNAT superfamily N-acetyltransferase